jgi:hypothetical protein
MATEHLVLGGKCDRIRGEICAANLFGQCQRLGRQPLERPDLVR